MTMTRFPLRVSRRHALVSLSALAASCALPNARAQTPDASRSILMVVQLDGPNIAVDRQIAAHLQKRGYQVQLVNQDFDPTGASGSDLVVISSTVSAKDVPAGWRTSPVPLLTWENDLLDDLAMCGKRHDVDFGETEKERYLWLVNAPHPVSAALPAGVANVFRKQAPMSWGKPGLGASIIATIYGQADKAAIFTYEKGATMDYEALAPARRVMFFMDNDSFTNLSAAGLRLFDAAIDWAARAPSVDKTA
ncbi:hypothetical protein [Paraburkholderia sp. J67]|uniref:hypothetical protein n=1 Tax=Paraburkholderia sp. J67 TaxID=2805435 RepID=UPI002ABD7CD8|nr:hypothetical protein [Paraburkholderia sp. J67]